MLTQESPIDAKEELSRFECAVAAPCIPGELQAWLSDVLAAADGLAMKMAWDAPRQSAALCDEIVADDPDLMQQADALKQAGYRLSDEFRRLRDDLRALRTDPHAGPEETVHRTKAPALVERSLLFVVHARQHFSELISCWLESLHRDRGAVD